MSEYELEIVNNEQCLLDRCEDNLAKNLGPVVQSIVSLTCLLVIKILTALPSTKSNSQVFLLKKCE